MRKPRHAEVQAELEKLPHINLTKMQVGTKVVVETTQGVYELVVENPRHAVVSITGSDPRLHRPLYCQVKRSIYDSRGQITLEYRIAKSLRMELKFLHGPFICSPTLSARVQGRGWYYDVF
jgi:hypothetical protein